MVWRVPLRACPTPTTSWCTMHSHLLAFPEADWECAQVRPPCYSLCDTCMQGRNAVSTLCRDNAAQKHSLAARVISRRRTASHVAHFSVRLKVPMSYWYGHVKITP